MPHGLGHGERPDRGRHHHGSALARLGGRRRGRRSAVRAQRPLVHRGEEIGATKIYAAEPHAFTEHEEHLLQLLATAAGALLGSAATTESLRRTAAVLHATLAERQAVQQAVGVLMERHVLEPEAAHTLLLRAAREQRTTVHQLAVRVVHRSDDPRL